MDKKRRESRYNEDKFDINSFLLCIEKVVPRFFFHFENIQIAKKKYAQHPSMSTLGAI